MKPTYAISIYLPWKKKKAVKKALAKTNQITPTIPITQRVKNLVTLENIVGSQEVEFRYRVNKKGGLNVAFEQIKK